LNILIIEDVDSKFADVRNVLAANLGETCKFVRATNLNEAEDSIVEDGWDLVIVDLSMDINGSGSVHGAGHATLGGLDVLERMSLLKLDHPVILVTGFDSFQDPDRFNNAIMNLADIDGLADSWLGKSYVGYVRYGPEGWAKRFARMLQQWSKI
jgi:CheY-like chemotaxis protein